MPRSCGGPPASCIGSGAPCCRALPSIPGPESNVLGGTKLSGPSAVCPMPRQPAGEPNGAARRYHRRRAPGQLTEAAHGRPFWARVGVSGCPASGSRGWGAAPGSGAAAALSGPLGGPFRGGNALGEACASAVGARLVHPDAECHVGLADGAGSLALGAGAFAAELAQPVADFGQARAPLALPEHDASVSDRWLRSWHGGQCPVASRQYKDKSPSPSAMGTPPRASEPISRVVTAGNGWTRVGRRQPCQGGGLG